VTAARVACASRDALVRFLLEEHDSTTAVWLEQLVLTDEWTAVVELAERWGAIPRLRERLSSSSAAVPEAVASLVDQRFRDSYARTVLQARAGLNVCAALHAAGLETVAFKGLASMAMLYGGAERRVILDADLLIRESDLVRAAAVLDSLGFQPSLPCELTRYVEFVRRAPGFGGNEVLSFHDDRGCTIDLHWRLGVIDAAKVIARSQRVVMMGSAFQAVAPEDGALLCAHHCLRNHFIPDRMIRDLLDLQQWCERIVSSGQLGATVARARATGLATSLQAATTIVSRYDDRGAAATLADGLDASASPKRRRDVAQLERLFMTQVREGPLDRDVLYLFRAKEFVKLVGGVLAGGRDHVHLAQSMDTVLTGRHVSIRARLGQLAGSLRRLRPHHVPLLRALARSKDEFALAEAER
jgi:hypothetical protein